MIRKWTVTFGSRAKKNLRSNEHWRQSVGFSNAMCLPGYLMYALAAGGLDERHLFAQRSRWGTVISKYLFVGREEHTTLKDAFTRGTRATVCVNAGVIDEGTELLIRFHGRYCDD